jgi:outer membrane translocation and assembly module TamA
MEFYKFDRFEILIPKVYGAEVSKEVSVPKTSGMSRRWDEATFFAKAEKELSEAEMTSLHKLYEFSLPYLKWNTNQTGTFSVKFNHLDPRKAFYTVYSTGVLELTHEYNRFRRWEERPKA